MTMTGSNQLREALVKARRFIDSSPLVSIVDDTGTIARGELCAEIDAALAAPPRNCDVGKADEQFERFGPFCNRYDDDCTGCPCDTADSSWNFTNCFARWAQMPYEEGGVK